MPEPKKRLYIFARCSHFTFGLQIISTGSETVLFSPVRAFCICSGKPARSSSNFLSSILIGGSRPIRISQPLSIAVMYIGIGSGLPGCGPCAVAVGGDSRKGRKFSCGLHFAATRKNISSRNSMSIIGIMRSAGPRCLRSFNRLRTILCVFSVFSTCFMDA